MYKFSLLINRTTAAFEWEIKHNVLPENVGILTKLGIVIKAIFSCCSK